MTVQPLVSVITPAYNAARFIRETLDSALAQTYPRVEVIVVDDGSTDETAEILRGYGSRIRYIHQTNQGVSAARNRAIAASHGEIIAFLDADDVWFAEKLALQVEEYVGHPETGMIACGTYYIDEHGVVFDQRKPSKFKSRQQAFKAFLIGNRINGGPSTVIVPKRCLDAVGGFDPMLHGTEDWDLWIRLAQRFSVRSVDRSLSRYRVHLGNFHKNITEMMQGQRAVIRTHRKSMSWLEHRKTVSFVHADAAEEYCDMGDLGRARHHALRAIAHYPPKVWAGDDKYAVLVKSLLPKWALSAMRQMRG